jgi:hypothetical protein
MIEDRQIGDDKHGAEGGPPATTSSHETPARKCKTCSSENDHPGREWARLVMQFLALLGMAY